MRLLITGSSDWKDSEMIDKTFDEFKKLYSKNEPFELMQFGTVYGVDAHVRKIGKKYGIDTLTYRVFGKTEKRIRNISVLKKHKPNILWIFCNNEPFGWMFDLIKKAKRRGISVNVFKKEEIYSQLDLFKDNDTD